MKRFAYLLLAVIIMGVTSCLKAGLDDLPAYEDANITDFYLEYRYQTTQDGNTVTKFVRLTTDSKDISDQATVNITVSIPAADGTFTEAERAKVSLTNIIGYCYLSNAARIEPIEGASTLGTVGNFSAPVKYKVTAADGTTSKVWTVTVILVK